MGSVDRWTISFWKRRDWQAGCFCGIIGREDCGCREGEENTKTAADKRINLKRTKSAGFVSAAWRESDVLLGSVLRGMTPLFSRRHQTYHLDICGQMREKQFHQGLGIDILRDADRGCVLTAGKVFSMETRVF